MFKASIDDYIYYNNFNRELSLIYDQLKLKFKDYFFMKDLKELINSGTGDYAKRFREFCKKLESVKPRTQSIEHIWDADVAIGIRNSMISYMIVDNFRKEELKERKYIYIPILRGIRHIDNKDLSVKEDLYRIKTVYDYKLNGDEQIKDVFTGLSIYEEIKRMLLGSKKERDLIREFEVFLSKNFFREQNVTLIPDYQYPTLKINIGNDSEDKDIHNVGDGIQAIILNTFQIFKHKNDEVMLFLEEPEMTMHPSIQRVLIETLIKEFPDLQIFLTTHSNHFLDLTYDYPDKVAIFSFEKEESNKFSIKNITDHSKILDLLGVRNSSVFLSNCVIWTEGVTDRMLLRKLLKLKGIKYKEDYHYAFAEYGGGNLENFDFVESVSLATVKVESISKTNFIIADNDGIFGKTEKEKNKPKFIRRKNIEQIIGEENFVDEHIEIENLIPYKIWKGVLDKLLKKKDKAFILKNSVHNAEEKFNSKLGEKKIGTLLKNFLIELVSEKKDIKYFTKHSVECLGEKKKEIMTIILEVIDELNISFSDFPQQAKEIVEKIENFIIKANRSRL